MAPSSKKKTVVLDYDRAWTYRDFMKEKLRNRERYWRQISEVPSFAANETKGGCYWVIPDGITWRKYLPLLTLLVEERACNLILLESAVDLMDYRSISPVVETESNRYQPEKPSPQERSKLSKLIQQNPGRVFPFCDLSVREEDHDEFEMMRYSSLSANERSKHSLLRAGRMLRQEFSEGDQNVIVFSADDDFVAKFPSEDGLDLILMDKLVSSFLEKEIISNVDSFIELKRRCEEDYISRNAQKSKEDDGKIKEYLTEGQIREGMKKKALAKGRLEVAKHSPKEASVVTSDGAVYFVNQQLGHFNRAFHHDVVIIKILPKSEWGSPVGKRRLVHHRDNDDDNGGLSLDTDSSPPVPSARVVAISESSRRQFIATMVNMPMNDESACLVIPMDMRIPKIRIKTNAWKRFVGKRLLIQVNAWDVESNYPAGHCNKIIGPIGDLETEIACLLHEHQLHLDPFSAAALACLPPEGREWTVPHDEIEKRLDLRSSHRIFSVDPPGCQDIDDTMHAKVLPNGDIEIGVHIADVTYFVRHNSPLDLEARIRGTTFYLVDRRFDMLPSLLSSDLCSLHGGTDRLAVSTIWTFSRDLKEIKSFWYGRTVIRNCQAMTYDQAHNIMHGKPPDDKEKPIPPPLTAGAPVDLSNTNELKHDLSILTRLARKLRKDREDIGGAVDLSSGDQGSELKFTLDKDNKPTQVTAKKQLEIHNTIAELMILSNTWVANNIYERSPDSALLRIHRSVEDSRFEDLKEILNARKISFDGKNNRALANSLKEAENATKSNSVMKSLFQSLAIRAMSEAQYVCTGQVGERDLSHYGLGLQRYTHFTSPIRRYADVVVHKQLLMPVTDSSSSGTSSCTIGSQNILPDLVPESKTISILGGEGIVRGKREQDTEDAATSPKPETTEGALDEKDISDTSDFIKPENGSTKYEPREVSRICDVLNRQNRMAKLSSMECQSLFLSLYFKKHYEVTKAVVTNLRTNGFWVYIPLFDMRGPVFLSDINGGLQIDPRLLNLDPSVGEKPTLGFAASGHARAIPSGRCTLVNSADAYLEVAAPEAMARYTLRTLDVVTVHISCDAWDARARIPMPRIHLIAESSNDRITFNANHPATKTAITSSTLKENHELVKGERNSKLTTPSMYSELMTLETPSLLPDIPFRTQIQRNDTADGQTIIAGRIVFGNFKNPDTRSAIQEVSIEEAAESAEQRRNQALAGQARSNEYDTTRRIQNDVTARMQRLQASKRNTRKSKGK